MPGKRQDFITDQAVRWCPGCGDYAVLAALQKVLPELEVPKENMVFFSGIGCASRLPYYLDTYGFHTIHGRAPALATGLKIARPDLSVWVITGDGDGLSIGASHIIHLLRRNVDVKVLLLNNQIYGLTKGQYSPTSTTGQVTVTSPEGALGAPLDPIAVALAAGGSFVARAIDVDGQGLQSVLHAAAAHKGTAFVEIYQNCNIFNDGVFEDFASKANRPAQTVMLTPGQPLVFGAEQEKGLQLSNDSVQIVSADEASRFESGEGSQHPQQLAHLRHPDYPMPIGIFRHSTRPTFEDSLTDQCRAQQKQTVSQLLRQGHTWRV